MPVEQSDSFYLSCEQTGQVDRAYRPFRIQSSTLDQLESNRQKLLRRLNPPERVGKYHVLARKTL